MKILIVYVSPKGLETARIIAGEMTACEVMSHREVDVAKLSDYEDIIFIGAMGICVRMIAPLVKNKYVDPAVVCVDSMGRYAVSVLSGHVGGGNELCRRIARILGGEAVITTQSDNADLWALDLLADKYGWVTDATAGEMNKAIFSFVNGEPCGLIVDVMDEGTRELLRSVPSHVTLLTDIGQAETLGLKLVIAITPRLLKSSVRVLSFYPKVLTIGVGCRKNCNPEGVADYIIGSIEEKGLSRHAVKKIATIDLKKDERLIAELTRQFDNCDVDVFTADELAGIEVANPSQKVYEVTGVYGVAESCAIAGADNGKLLIEKQKGSCLKDNEFTYAVALQSGVLKQGHIEIVGAGPGDPELVSVKGKRFLEEADLILYAGSLVPIELTHYAKPGCVVRSSASMNLEEQFALMKEFYDKGLLVVRLHTGDPCIYGAIQEQMAYFDRYGMSYHISPGISSFQAAAAALRSQYTIPEKVQSIILTRGEGRTPMPEKEKLHLLARSQSTMCIYLSAAIVDDVQRELLMAYPPETPVAACYKLTWKEERIYRGQLKDLAEIVHSNNLTLTTLLVVGEAIDNRCGLSKLYDRQFSHLFRK